MFKLSSDHLANFRSIGALLETFKGWINDLRLRIGNTEDRLDVLESTPGSSSSTPSDINSGQVVVDFGSSFCHFAETVVPATWVTTASKITVSPFTTSNDHVEITLLGFQPVIGTIDEGVSFTLSVYTPVEAKGTYSFSYLGV